MKVLISAYACEPNRGSEPEVGWQWALQMARFHEVTIITRSNNKAVIEAELTKISAPNLSFFYYDEPSWALKIKKIFKAHHWYYLRWQKSVHSIIQNLLQEHHFDLLHHITYAAYRYPTAIWSHGTKTLWGPIGGGETVPWGLLPWKYPKSLFQELVRNIANSLITTSLGSLKKHVYLSTAVIASTKETQDAIKKIGRQTTPLMPAVGITVLQENNNRISNLTAPLRLLYVGNLLYLKGLDLALEALKKSLTDATLTIIGEGPFDAALKQRVRQLELNSRVFFRGRLPRTETLKSYSDYDLFIFPSLHDSGGFAVLEAMSYHLPVICLDCGGPAFAVQKNCGIKVPLDKKKKVVSGLSDAIRYYNENREMLKIHGDNACLRLKEHYDWKKKGESMNDIYLKIMNEEFL